jgi:hypothetical protein
MQCNVEFGYKLSICCGIEENDGKPWSSWPIAGPSGCRLTSSQQTGIKYSNPNISPYLAIALFVKNRICFYRFHFFMCIIWMSASQLCIILSKIMHVYMHINVFMFVIIWVMVNFNIYCSGGMGCRMRLVACPITEDCMLQFIVRFTITTLILLDTYHIVDPALPSNGPNLPLLLLTHSLSLRCVYLGVV